MKNNWWTTIYVVLFCLVPLNTLFWVMAWALGISPSTVSVACFAGAFVGFFNLSVILPRAKGEKCC